LKEIYGKFVSIYDNLCKKKSFHRTHVNYDRKIHLG